MYEIHFTDNTGIKDLTQKCDVRMNIVIQYKNHKRIVEKVLQDGNDITAFAMHGLPVERGINQ